MKRLQARTLQKVRRWMLDESKPLSFVLDQLGLTLRRWEIIVENDGALRDVLDMVRLREEEALLENLKTATQHKVTGSIFVLKAKHKYQDQHKPVSIEPPPAFNVTVMIPAPAKSTDEWNRIIDVTPEPPAIENKADGQ